MTRKPRTIAVHPNSTAALMWGRRAWSSALTDREAPPRTVRRRPVFTTQEEARSVACSVCGAQLGRYCIGARGLRLSAHDSRHIAALDAGALPATRKRSRKRRMTARDKR